MAKTAASSGTLKRGAAARRRAGGAKRVKAKGEAKARVERGGESRAM
jgi:hypothetical protein